MAEFFGKGISVGSGFDLGANAYYSAGRRSYSICKRE